MKKHRSKLRLARSELADPDLPSVDCKIKEADEYAGSRQNSCGDVGINQFVQVMEEKAALVRVDAGPCFEPVLKPC